MAVRASIGLDHLMHISMQLATGTVFPGNTHDGSKVDSMVTNNKYVLIYPTILTYLTMLYIVINILIYASVL